MAAIHQLVHVAQTDDCRFPMAGNRPFPAMNPELLALIGAMEFLFPYKERKKLFDEKKPDFFSVAGKFKIPRILAAMFLEDSYMTKLGE